MVIQAETNNSHKESKPIESEDESDSKSFEPESIDFDIDSDIDSEYDFEDHEAMYLDMCENLRAKIPARNQYPYSLLDSFNSQWVDNGNLTLAFDHGLWFWNWLFVIYLNYLIIYLFVQLCDIFSHIYFESDLNCLFGSFNILNEAWLYSFNDPDDC